jgi:hypothetical protein
MAGNEMKILGWTHSVDSSERDEDTEKSQTKELHRKSFEKGEEVKYDDEDYALRDWGMGKFGQYHKSHSTHPYSSQAQRGSYKEGEILYQPVWHRSDTGFCFSPKITCP